MRSPYHGVRPPYTLPSNIVFFHDWRYVDVGSHAWLGPEGESVPLFGKDPIPPMHMEYDMACGIRLVAQPAQMTEPVITAEDMGESFLGCGTVIYEEGRYRLWYECVPIEEVQKTPQGHNNLLRYAESVDGIHWERPALGIVEFRGSRNNNIVYGGPLTPEHGYHGGCVFKDPSAPPEERYKVFYLGMLSPEDLEAYRKRRPEDIDPSAIHPNTNYIFAIFGGVSPDGLHWTPLPDPLVVQASDTHNVCTYDTVRGKYIAYVRTWYFGRRTIGISESDDFRHFSIPDELMWPDAGMEPSHTWYGNAKTIMPGTTDYHVMFPLKWILPEDIFEFHLATSPDGIVWNMVPGGAVCRPGPHGNWNSCGVSAQVGLVALPDRRMGVLIYGWPVPHKYPRRPPLGKFAWAWWPQGRLVALEAPGEGKFSLYPLLFKGKRIYLNYCTKVAGYVQVEAQDAKGKTLPGRSFADCDPINGDSLEHLVTWRGQADLGHKPGQPVKLRFRLRYAKLFSVKFRD